MLITTTSRPKRSRGSKNLVMLMMGGATDGPKGRKDGLMHVQTMKAALTDQSENIFCILLPMKIQSVRRSLVPSHAFFEMSHPSRGVGSSCPPSVRQINASSFVVGRRPTSQDIFWTSPSLISKTMTDNDKREIPNRLKRTQHQSSRRL
jgi:hypothetical protein